MSSVLAYTVSTGEAPRLLIENDLHDPEIGPLFDDPNDGHEPFCFVCGRCTDHFGEHDDQVEAGEAFYASDGTVYAADMWHACANPALKATAA